LIRPLKYAEREVTLTSTKSLISLFEDLPRAIALKME